MALVRPARAPLALALLLLASALAVAAPGDAPDGPSADADATAPLFAWLSPADTRRLEAGERIPLAELPLFPQETDDPIGDLPLPYSRIRPGSPLGVTQLACTANFVFTDGTRLAIGTAGHCTGVGLPHHALVVDPGSQTIGLVPLGTTVLRVSGGIGSDFALIEVDPERHDLVHPAIAQIDGPCGWRAAAVGDAIQFHGHGLGFGAGGQTRTGAITAAWDATSIHYVRFPGGAGGDSGSPVRFLLEGGGLDFAAAGLNTHGLGPIGAGTSMPRVFEIMAEQGFGAWTLVDSPNCALFDLPPGV